MNSLADLNAPTLTFIAEGNVEGMQKCIQYSLQPKLILQAIFDSKRYECLPTASDLLLYAFKVDEPIAAEIYVDLLERKDLVGEIPFPGGW